MSYSEREMRSYLVYIFIVELINSIRRSVNIIIIIFNTVVFSQWAKIRIHENLFLFYDGRLFYSRLKFSTVRGKPVKNSLIS